jgi:hypothetical protein
MLLSHFPVFIPGQGIAVSVDEVDYAMPVTIPK